MIEISIAFNENKNNKHICEDDVIILIKISKRFVNYIDVDITLNFHRIPTGSCNKFQI